MTKPATRTAILGLAIVLAGCGAGVPALSINLYGLVAPVFGFAWSDRAAAKPASTALDLPAFVERARQVQTCNEFGNRLVQIDGRYVYWEVSGACLNHPQRRELYGSSPAELLCTTVDTVAGAIARCNDERLRAMFDTILRNRDRAALGLDAGHSVQPVSLLPPHGTVLAAHEIAVASHSRVLTPETVVVRDQASWQQLWARHAGAHDTARPSIDFGRQIVVAVFGGAAASCREVGYGRIVVEGEAVAVDHFERVQAEAAECAQGSAPVRMVALERNDAEVRFHRLDSALDRFRTLGQGRHSDVAQPRQMVLRSAAELSALWREVNGQATLEPLPEVDFRQQMVLAVLAGRASSGCNETGIRAVYHRGQRLVVSYADLVLGTSRKAARPGARQAALVCTQPAAAPYHLVAVARHDGPVEFAPQVRMHGGSD